MPVKTNKTAGDDVESRCLKCKAVTNHTIIAMADDAIAKVQCNSCKARHKYRAPVAEKKKSSSLRRRGGTVTKSSKGTTKAKTSKTPRKKISRGVINFEALIKDKDISAAIPYAIDVTLTAGDLLNHNYEYWHQLFNERQLLCLDMLLRAIIELKDENVRLRVALEHIVEYWNKSENDTAMIDALDVIIGTAETALKGGG